MSPNIYLNFPGTAEEALGFYADVFASEVTHLQRMSDLPDFTPVEGTEALIMHARLKIGEMSLMATDHIEAFSGPWQGHSGFSIQIPTDTPEEAAHLFGKLREGGVVTMPMAETFWARAFGSCKDRFGVAWMVNCD